MRTVKQLENGERITRTRTVKQIQSLIDRKTKAFSKAYKKYNEDVDALVEELKTPVGKWGGIRCDHSKTQKYTWEWDSGYGRQSMREGTRCNYCGFESPYSDGRFHNPDDRVDRSN